MTITSDFQLTDYAHDIAHDIARDAKDFEQATDWAHEAADGSEHVIYTYKAHSVCQHCNVDQGEAFYIDCYSGTRLKTYDEIASIMAYGELLARIQGKLWEIFEEREDAA